MGMLVWCTIATADNNFYESCVDYYFIWNRIVLFCLAFTILSKPKEVRQFKPVVVLIGIQLAWEQVSLLTGLAVNNNIYVGLVFIIVVIVCIILYIKSLNKWRRQNS